MLIFLNLKPMGKRRLPCVVLIGLRIPLLEDYLTYELLLEQFAADLLAKYEPDVLPRFLDLYRQERAVLLSDDATIMLVSVLGAGGEEWLESLVYF